MLRAPREGEKAPFIRYQDEPLRVQLSTDESTLGAVREFLEKSFKLHVDESDLGGQVERIVFGKPTGDGLTTTPLTGQYKIIVRVRCGVRRIRWGWCALWWVAKCTA